MIFFEELIYSLSFLILYIFFPATFIMGFLIPDIKDTKFMYFQTPNELQKNFKFKFYFYLYFVFFIHCFIVLIFIPARISNFFLQKTFISKKTL